MKKKNEQRHTDQVFHERPQLLSSEAYRGFSVEHTEQHWEGVKMTVTNADGTTISATGETEHEALETLIDQIDYFLDQ
jgi:hypothetical protein